MSPTCHGPHGHVAHLLHVIMLCLRRSLTPRDHLLPPIPVEATDRQLSEFQQRTHSHSPF
ncbi:hypothetical protein P7K49_031367 [Saguinus oedipus]|uniref:Uncharacterized protein n=1 Tax=Saguinus oedipus TaxID=9490 RepID=A0ABQ9TZW8_SAGOE|nr:hypothetical protein P7K49_031367 [Saguinus oedipus]